MDLFKITYYIDSRGDKPVFDYIKALGLKRDKDSRIKFNKIMDYINALRTYGITAGEPYMKHLEGDIWELRPIRDRILFAAWNEDEQGFILLHQFMKQTRKTPQREIDIAKHRLQEVMESKNDE
jgi:phage-related protein